MTWGKAWDLRFPVERVSQSPVDWVRADAAVGGTMSCLETLTQYRGRHRTGRQLCLKGERMKGGSLPRMWWWEGFLEPVVLEPVVLEPVAEWSLKALSFGVRPWLGV